MQNKQSKIKLFFYNILLGIREIFISEKQKFISVKTLDNLNLNFKNLSPYSEVNIYKTISSLVFISIFVLIIGYFTFLDIKYNLIKNNALVENKPALIIIENPLSLVSENDYEEVEYLIKKNDTVLSILIDKINLNKEDAYNCIKALQQVYNLKNLKVGQKIYFKFKTSLNFKENKRIEGQTFLTEMRLSDDNTLQKITVKNINNTFKAENEKMKLNIFYNKYYVYIKNSLYLDCVNAGIPYEIIKTLISYYSFDIDFQRDLRSGDTLEIVFEAHYTDNGKKIKNGNIVFSNLYTNKKNYNFYRFIKNNIFVGYFDTNGLSSQKSLLKTPIDGARISSGFNLKRKHPVLGYTREHKGVDFAAPIGTPFYAAGSGTIVKVINNCKNGNRRCGGGYGNYIQIKHNDSYITEYAHASKINSDLREGIKISQGNVIGYVGETGITTGPHLHYGIIYKGERINPNNIKTLPAIRLKGEQLMSFFEEKDRINILRKTAINQNSSL